MVERKEKRKSQNNIGSGNYKAVNMVRAIFLKSAILLSTCIIFLIIINSPLLITLEFLTEVRVLQKRREPNV